MRRGSRRYSQAPISRPSSQETRDVFPILPNDEIIETLNKYNILIEERTLNKPNEQVAIRIFQSILHISGLDINYNIEDFVAEEDIPSHMDTVHLFVVLDKLQKLFLACQVNRFSYTDLIKPNAKDFKRHLSAWINFQRFRNNRAAQLNPIFNKSQVMYQKTKEIVKQREDLVKKKTELYEGDDKMADKQMKYNAAKSEADKKREEAKQPKMQLASLEERTKETEEEIELLKYKEDELKESIKQLEREIVPSPKRLQEQKANLEASIAQCHRELQELKQESQHEKEEIQQIVETTVGIKNTIAKVKDFIKAEDEVYRANEKLFELENKLTLLKVEAKDTAARKELKEKMFNDTAKHYDDQIDALVSECQEVKATGKKLRRKRARLKKQKADVSRKIEEEQVEYEKHSKDRKEYSDYYQNKENSYRENGVIVVNALTEQFQKAADMFNAK